MLLLTSLVTLYGIVKSDQSGCFAGATITEIGEINPGETTFQVLTHFYDPECELLAVHGDERGGHLSLRFEAFGGELINHQSVSVEASLYGDSPTQGITLPGDSWLTIGAEDSQNTAFSPGFLGRVGSSGVIHGDFFEQVDNGGYYDQNPSTQELDNREGILIAQFTLPTGADFSYQGTVSFTDDHAQVRLDTFSVTTCHDIRFCEPRDRPEPEPEPEAPTETDPVACAEESFVGVTISNMGRINQGETTFRVYAHFDDQSCQLITVMGDEAGGYKSLKFQSTGGSLINHQLLPVDTSVLGDTPTKGFVLPGDSWLSIGDESTQYTLFSPNFLESDGQSGAVEGDYFEQRNNGGYYDQNFLEGHFDSGEGILIAQFALPIRADFSFQGTLGFQAPGGELRHKTFDVSTCDGDSCTGSPEPAPWPAPQYIEHISSANTAMPMLTVLAMSVCSMF